MTANPLNSADVLALQRAAYGGLCGVCRHARLVRSSRESAFVRCTQPEPPKYPPQPVRGCAFYGDRTPESVT